MRIHIAVDSLYPSITYVFRVCIHVKNVRTYAANLKSAYWSP